MANATTQSDLLKWVWDASPNFHESNPHKISHVGKNQKSGLEFGLVVLGVVLTGWFTCRNSNTLNARPKMGGSLPDPTMQDATKPIPERQVISFF